MHYAERGYGADGLPPTPHNPLEGLRPSPEIGIYDENDRLTRAALWGPVGAEAVLAQIYPERISLFYDAMDVPAARGEAMGFISTLQDEGVEIHIVRDILAQEILPPVEGVTREQLIAELQGRAQGIYEQYYDANGVSKHGDEPPAGGPKQLQSYFAPIAELVDADIERYGLERAVALNEYLSIDRDMPLGDSIYARDQMNVLLGTRFVSNMAHNIRKPEVPMFEAVYKHIGLPPGVEIPDGETFEGGDAWVHNEVVYVGVGERTTEGAAEFIYQTLKPQLDQLGFRFVMVKDMMLEQKTPKRRQQFMHLDTFSSPTALNEIVVCDFETDNRRVIELTNDKAGSLIKTDVAPFVDFLIGQGDVVRHVPEISQAEFACNFLTLDNNAVLMADTNKPENEAISQMLENAGKRVIRVPLEASTRGYGATHCMTGQLARSR